MADTTDQLTDFARDASSAPMDYKPTDLLVDDEDELPATFEEDEDGNIIILDPDTDSNLPDVEFDGNLAEVLSSAERIAMGNGLIELIEQDIQDRLPHDRKYAEGIKRTGMAEENAGAAAFEGGTVVTHPVLVECCVDFQSSAMKELMPPSGPVKTKIMGRVAPEKREKAERKRDYMNWQITEQIEEYCDTLENLLMQLPLSGDQYRHIYFDTELGRPAIELLGSDNVFIPYGTTNFYQAERLTLREELTEAEIEVKIDSGDWIDISTDSSSLLPERTRAQAASEAVEGVDESMNNEDGLRRFYRVFTWGYYDFDNITKGARAPYMLIIDADTGEIPVIRRNWDEADPKRLKLDHVVDWRFFPWRGPYAIGLGHMIGGMAAAMTGALRALLDTAHINNFPSLLKMKSKTGGQTLSLEATGITEIEGTTPVDDIRKLIMPVPFNPPSTVLFQLLGWLNDVAKGVVATAEEKIAEATNSGPVGTTLALIEQGSKVYANIHSRLHRSAKKELSILHRLNRMYLDEEQVIEEIGDEIIYRKDFDGPLDVIPVSDPNIFSEAQRYAQLQAVRQIQQMNPEMFKTKELVRRELKQLRIESPEELLVPDPEMTRANPVAENIMMSKGMPASAFPDQDHMAHMKVLITYMQDQNFGASPLIAPKFMALAVQHLADHLVLWYGTYMYDALGKVIGPEFSQIMEMEQTAGQVDKVIGLIADQIHTNMDTTLKGMPEVVNQALQILQQYSQQQNPQLMEVQRKQARDQVDAELKRVKEENNMLKAKMKDQLDQKRIAVAEKEIEQEAQNTEVKAATSLLESQRDNETALTIAAMEIESGENIGVSTGHDSM